MPQVQTLDPWEEGADGRIILPSSLPTDSPESQFMWFLGNVGPPVQASVTVSSSQLETAASSGLSLRPVTPVSWSTHPNEEIATSFAPGSDFGNPGGGNTPDSASPGFKPPAPTPLEPTYHPPPTSLRANTEVSRNSLIPGHSAHSLPKALPSAPSLLFLPPAHLNSLTLSPLSLSTHCSLCRHALPLQAEF